MNIGYHSKLVGVVNDDRYGRGVEHVGLRRKKIGDLAKKAIELRALEAAKEDLEKLDKENKEIEREAALWAGKAAQLEANIDGALRHRKLSVEEKAAALARYAEQDKVRLAVKLELVEEQLAAIKAERDEKRDTGIDDIKKLLTTATSDNGKIKALKDQHIKNVALLASASQKVKDLSSKIEALEAQHSKITTTLATVSKSSDKKGSVIDELKAKCATALEELADARRAAKDEKTARMEEESTAKGLQKEIEAIKASREQAMEELADARKATEDEKMACMIQASAVERLGKEIDNLKVGHDQAIKEEKTARTIQASTAEALRKEVEGLKVRYNQAIANLTAARKATEEVKTTRRNYELTALSLEGEVKGLRGDLVTARENFSSELQKAGSTYTTSLIEAHRDNEKKLQTTITEAGTKYQALEKAMAELKSGHAITITDTRQKLLDDHAAELEGLKKDYDEKIQDATGKHTATVARVQEKLLSEHKKAIEGLKSEYKGKLAAVENDLKTARRELNSQHVDIRKTAEEKANREFMKICEGLKAGREDTTKALSDAVAQKELLETECSSLRDKDSAARDREVEASRTITDLQAKLHHHEATNATLSAELAEAKGMAEGLKATASEVAAEREKDILRIEGLETAVAEHKEVQASLQAEMAEKDKRAQELKDAVAEGEALGVGLREELAEKDKLVQELKEAAAEGEALGLSLREELAEKDKYAHELEGAVAEHQETGSRLQAEVAEKDKRVQKLEAAAILNDKASLSLQSKLTETQDHIAVLERAAVEHQKAVSRLEEHETTITSLEASIAEYQTLLAEIQEQVEQSADDVSVQIKGLKEELSRHRLEKKHFAVDIEAVKGERDSLQKQVGRMKTEIEELKSQRDKETEEQLAREHGEAELTTVNDDLQRCLDETEDDRQDLDARITTMAKQLKEEVAENERIRLDLATANRRIIELENPRPAKSVTASSVSFEGVDQSSPVPQSSTGSRVMLDIPNRGRSFDDSSVEIQAKDKRMRPYKSPSGSSDSMDPIERARMQAMTFSRAGLARSNRPPAWRTAPNLRAPRRPLDPNAAPWVPQPASAPVPFGFPGQMQMPMPPWVPPPWAMMPPPPWGFLPPPPPPMAYMPAPGMPGMPQGPVLESAPVQAGDDAVVPTVVPRKEVGGSEAVVPAVVSREEVGGSETAVSREAGGSEVIVSRIGTGGDSEAVVSREEARGDSEALIDNQSRSIRAEVVEAGSISYAEAFESGPIRTKAVESGPVPRAESSSIPHAEVSSVARSEAIRLGSIPRAEAIDAILPGSAVIEQSALISEGVNEAIHTARPPDIPVRHSSMALSSIISPFNSGAAHHVDIPTRSSSMAPERLDSRARQPGSMALSLSTTSFETSRGLVTPSPYRFQATSGSSLSFGSSSLTTPSPAMPAGISVRSSRGMLNPVDFISSGMLRTGEVVTNVHTETIEVVTAKIREWKGERGIDPDTPGDAWALPHSRRVMCIYLKLHTTANEALNLPADKNPSFACPYCVESRNPCMWTVRGSAIRVLPLPPSARSFAATPQTKGYYIRE
ncbi:hypothetical protein V490_07591 [Pseudogymnoascus sp. VKM F-3557]|nr:hypothetical protein V490_07591 [Pseudogymnoascus sp. VKM F-3557]